MLTEALRTGRREREREGGERGGIKIVNHKIIELYLINFYHLKDTVN